MRYHLHSMTPKSWQLILISLLLLVSILPIPQLTGVASAQEIWLSYDGVDFAFKAEIPVEGSVGAGTDYQVSVTVYPGNGTNSAGVLYLNEGAESFPDDVWFTDEGNTTLSFKSFPLTDADTSSLRYWINVEDDLDGNQTICAYWGHPTAPNIENGLDTFLAYSDGYVEPVEGIRLGGGVHSAILLDTGYIGYMLSGKFYTLTTDGEFTSVEISTAYSSSIGETPLAYDGNNTIWAFNLRAVGGVYEVKKSVDKGVNWGDAVEIVSSGYMTPNCIYYDSDTLITSIVGTNGYAIYVKISADGGATWGNPVSVIISSPSGFARREHPDLIKLANGDVLCGYEEEVTEAGNSGLAQVRSATQGASWGARENILTIDSYDNENGLYVQFSSGDLWYIFPCDYPTGGSYTYATIQGVKSTNSGASWGARTVLYDSKDKVSIHGLVVIDSSHYYLQCFRRYEGGVFDYLQALQIILDIASPSLYSDYGWNQRQGTLYTTKSSGTPVLVVQGNPLDSKIAYSPLGNESLADYAVEARFWNNTATADARMLGRFSIAYPYTNQDASKDAFLAKSVPNQNYGDDVNGLRMSDSSVGTRRIVVEFNLSAYAGLTVAEVYFSLYYWMEGGTDPNNRGITVYRLTRSDWVEGTGSSTSDVSWNHYAVTTHWTTVGGDYDPEMYASTTMPSSTAQWVTFDVTELAQDALDNRSNMLELLVRFDDEANAAACYPYFWSEERGGAAAPKIDLVLTAPLGEWVPGDHYMLQAGNDTLELYKYVSGSYTLVDDDAITNTGDWMDIRWDMITDGSDLVYRSYFNGDLILDDTQSPATYSAGISGLSTSVDTTAQAVLYIFMREVIESEPIVGIPEQYSGIDIDNTPPSHDFGLVQPSSTYWGNGTEPGWPLADGNCTGNVTNLSSFSVDIYFSMGNMTGGIQWTIGATPASNIFTMKVCISGAAGIGNCTVLSATPQMLIEELLEDASEYWEFVFYTPTNTPQFDDKVPKSGNITLGAEAH